MKLIKIILLLILIAGLCFGGLMIWKAFNSHKIKPNVGLIDGQLKSCGSKPNCVSSFAEEGSKFYIAPLVAENTDVIWDNLNMTLDDLNLKMVEATETYIHATSTTPLMRFVDDVEFLLDSANNTIHMRSASRVGYSDMGANLKRLEKIKSLLMKSED